MSNKILNTRLQVRIDELTNWRNSTIKLLPGELAIATVAATAGTGLEEPVCMIKIGDYKRTASGAIERDADGKGILQTFEELPYALHAKSSDVLAACKTQSGLENFVKGVLASEGVASDAVVSGLAERIGTLETKVDVTKVTTAIKDAIDALNIPTTYAKNSDVELLKTELNNNISTAEGRVNEKITTLTNNAATKQELSDLENAAATKTALAEVSAAVDTKADKTAFEKVEKTVKDFFSEEAVIEGAIDTLKEIATYIANDETGASTLAARVGAIETKVDVEKVSTAISNAVAGETALREAADTAEKKAREDADTALSNRIKVYEDAKDSYAAKSELERVEGIANAAYVLPEGGIEEDLSADVKTSLGRADSALQEIIPVENGGLKVTNKNQIEIDDKITFIFDCGDAFGNPLN